MSQSKLADFTAFLSLSVDDEQVFEAREGRVVVTDDHLVAAGEGTSRRLPLESLAEFDFRTVPEGWEQFFDDLIGIRFERPDGEMTLTVGTESTVAVRFVTVLLKLVLTEMGAGVRQRRYPLDGEPETEEGESAFRLLPKRECIRFDAAGIRPIGVAAITAVEATESGLQVCHLSERGRIRTDVTFESPRATRLFGTYLEFRNDLAEYAGPVRFVYLGADRNTLSFLARQLDERGLPFEAGHAHTAEELFGVLGSVTAECVVAERDLPDATGVEFAADLAGSDHEVPLVLVGEDERVGAVSEYDAVLDAVRVDRDGYARAAEAIERAAVATRF